MDNTPNGPYKHYERPSHGRADNEQPSPGGNWRIVISVLIIVLVILIPGVHYFASRNVQKAEQPKEVQRVSQVSSHRSVVKHKKHVAKNKKKSNNLTNSLSAQHKSGAKTYVVQDGDTLTDIAEKHGMSVSELAALNGLDQDSSINAGDTLKLK